MDKKLKLILIFLCLGLILISCSPQAGQVTDGKNKDRDKGYEDPSKNPHIKDSGKEEKPEYVKENFDNMMAYFLKMDPYQAQRFARNPVYFYKHPSLNIGLDLRDKPDWSRELYVLPVEKGFKIGLRRLVHYEGKFDMTQEIGEDLLANYFFVTSDRLKDLPTGYLIPALAHNEAGDSINLDGVNYFIYESDIYGQQSNGAYIEELFNPDYKDDVYQVIIDSLVESQERKVQLNLEQVDSDREWEEIICQLKLDPSIVEYKYSLPLYCPNIDFESHPGYLYYKYNHEFAPLYFYGKMDADGDGAMEYFLSCYQSITLEDKQGYWAVFKESKDGLRMVDLTLSNGYEPICYELNKVTGFKTFGSSGFYELRPISSEFIDGSYSIHEDFSLPITSLLESSPDILESRTQCVYLYDYKGNYADAYLIDSLLLNDLMKFMKNRDFIYVDKEITNTYFQENIDLKPPHIVEAIRCESEDFPLKTENISPLAGIDLDNGQMANFFIDQGQWIINRDMSEDRIEEILKEKFMR